LIEAIVTQKVEQLYRYGPVPTVAVARAMGTHPRQVREWLSRAARRRLVARVSARGGWLPPEAERMTRAQRRVFDALVARYRHNYRYNGRPVNAGTLAAKLGRNVSTVWRHLEALERRGHVRRVGVRGGWLPLVGEHLALTDEEQEALDALREIWHINRGPMRTEILSGLIDKSVRQTCNICMQLERKGFVRRVGVRGGWLPA
jgi:Mn-dependent DtxR family transcriptional regulator